MEISDILNKYGFYGRSGRVRFDNYAYILIAKKLGLNWNNLTHIEKISLKGEMIDEFAETGSINVEAWEKLNEVDLITEQLENKS